MQRGAFLNTQLIVFITRELTPRNNSIQHGLCAAKDGYAQDGVNMLIHHSTSGAFLLDSLFGLRLHCENRHPKSFSVPFPLLSSYHYYRRISEHADDTALPTSCGSHSSEEVTILPLVWRRVTVSRGRPAPPDQDQLGGSLKRDGALKIMLQDS